MRIVLVITDTKRKSLFFVADNLAVYTLQKAVALAREDEIPDVYVVDRKTSTYLRTKPSVPKNEELKNLSLSISGFYDLIHSKKSVVSTPAIHPYIKTYLSAIEKEALYITPVDWYRIPSALVRKRLQTHRTHIFNAAKRFKIDPYLLGAIVIDEIARAHTFEPILDAIKGNLLGLNASAGIAQVKLSTANDLIKKGFYNPDPDNPDLPFQKLNTSTRRHLYGYVKEPKHSIFFAAAYVRSIIDVWLQHNNLSNRPEIIGTLYHRSYKAPHPAPEPDKRGLQIAEEFYPLARQWLGSN